MNGKAKKLVPHIPRARLLRCLRTAGTGVVAAVIAVGVLFTAAASVPAAHPSADGGDLPIRLYGLLQSGTVGETETAPDGVTIAQVVAVLKRAEEQAREEGPDFSPTIAQAAAELGMLYTTYQMQQLASGENNAGPRLEDAPVVRRAENDADGPVRRAEHDGADEKAGEEAGEEKGRGRSGDGVEEPQPAGDTPRAVAVSNKRASVIDPHPADLHDDPQDDPHTGYVTYDEVVIAAVRLANMLDPSVPNALVEVEGAEGRTDFSLRENLLDVVTTFGGTTTGYANGRIPTDVLCPLEFAPGHMLRCDAAERLTALSEQFEREFGYAIPMTDSYRSYELQVAVAGAKPLLAAVPGTSNHGWGLAVDLGNPIAGGNSAEYVWLRLHGPDYGWDNPSWARLGGEKPEPWHFEFFAAGSIPNRAIDSSDVGTWTPAAPEAETPRYKPALDPKPNESRSTADVRKPTAKPSDGPRDHPPAQKPPKPASKPGSDSGVPAPGPADSGTGPDDPDEEPGEPGKDPADPGAEPADPGAEPVDPGTAPADPDGDPVDPGTDPVDPGTEPVDPGTEPTDPGTEPTDPGTEPTDPACPTGDGDGDENGAPEPAPSTTPTSEPDTDEPDTDEPDTDEPAPCPDDGSGDEPEGSTGTGDQDEPAATSSSTLLGTLPEALGLVGDDTED